MALARKIAYIDLSTGEIKKESIPKRIRELYLGSRGIDSYLLYNHVKPGTDGLSPENVLLISAGLLGGTPAPASSRCHVSGKSPLTGIVGSTNMGGFFAPEMRFAGFDHLVIKGKAKRPVYLWINDGEIEIRDATRLWGKDTFETQERIREENGDENIQVLCIGQGGENLVRFACVRTGLKNTGGRTGMGAIMGSKNLKAVAARGTMDIKLSHPQETLDYCDKTRSKIMSTKLATALGVDGTMAVFPETNTSGLVRVKNLQSNQLDEWEGLTIDKFHDNYGLGTVACFGCPVHCRHRWRINDGPYAGTFGEGPEYNTMLTMGGIINVKNWEPILIGQKLCDKYGIDFSEVGNLFAWAMELYEKGIIDKNVTGGLDIDWNNAEQNLPIIIEQIVHREGLGAILAEGPIRALGKIGKESEYYLMHVKGQSILGGDDRPAPGLALGAAVSSRGWDHLRSRPAIDLYHLPEDFLKQLYGAPVSSDYTSYEWKPWQIRWHERLYAVIDSLGTCKMHAVFLSPNMLNLEDYASLIYYITGMEISVTQLEEIGDRIITIERMFCHREMGITRKDDYYPERFYKEPTPSGLPFTKGRKLDRKKWDKMLDQYYELHGWDNNGVPMQETLQKLGLDNEPSHVL